MSLPSIHWLTSIAEESVDQLKRHSTAVSEVKNHDLYLHGGFKLSKSGKKVAFFNDIWKISVMDNKKLRCVKISSGHGDIPEARAYHHLHVFENLLILFGGKSSLNETSCIPGTYEYDILSRKWSRLRVSGEEPQQLYGSSCRVDSHLIVFGGHVDGVPSNDTYVYDILSRHWHRALVSGEPPQPRCEHACAAVGSLVFIFGGTGGAGCFFNDLHQLDTTTLQWTRVQPEGQLLPMPRAGLTLTAQHSKDLYLFGGYNDCVFPDGGPVQEPMMKFSLDKKCWKVPGVVPQGGQPDNTMHHCAWVHKGLLYIFGGVGLEDSQTLVKICRIVNPNKRKQYLQALSQCANEDEMEWESEAPGARTASMISSARSSFRQRPFSISQQEQSGRSAAADNNRSLELLRDRIRDMGDLQ